MRVSMGGGCCRSGRISPASRHKAGGKGASSGRHWRNSCSSRWSEGKYPHVQCKEENYNQYFTFLSFLRIWQEYKELGWGGGNIHRPFVMLSLRFQISGVGVILVACWLQRHSWKLLFNDGYYCDDDDYKLLLEMALWEVDRAWLQESAYMWMQPWIYYFLTLDKSLKLSEPLFSSHTS